MRGVLFTESSTVHITKKSLTDFLKKKYINLVLVDSIPLSCKEYTEGTYLAIVRSGAAVHPTVQASGNNEQTGAVVKGSQPTDVNTFEIHKVILQSEGYIWQVDKYRSEFVCSGRECKIEDQDDEVYSELSRGILSSAEQNVIFREQIRNLKERLRHTYTRNTDIVNKSENTIQLLQKRLDKATSLMTPDQLYDFVN